VQNSGNYSHKISHFNWLTDWLIDWLLSFPYSEFILVQPYIWFISHTVFHFSVVLKNESNKRERRCFSSIYWLRSNQKSHLPHMNSSILYHTLHYIKSVSALLIGQLFLQSLSNLSFIHSPSRALTSLLLSDNHQHSVIGGHLIWFPLFVLGCRSLSRLSLKCHILYSSQAVFCGLLYNSVWNMQDLW